ncbi:MAG: hypothetical protein OXF68_07475 [Gammaproteobacteria bacterium]|nr:hypothetical protein [Gammaproteobacteria bacterium]
MMEDICRIAVLFIAAALLAACGGSSDNASPGSVVVEVEVQPPPAPEPEPEPDPEPEPGNGSTVASVIPAHLQSAIVDSGSTADSGFGGKPIHTIDVAALAGGALDPTGLVLGNDYIFEISGGAARITPPAGAQPSRGGSLPDCQLKIAPGGVIVGSSSADFLVINRGCALIAEGTADQPILLTAKAEVLGTAEDNDRGLWGGLVINGYAPINDCPEGAAGGSDDCIKEGEANSGQFGGSNSNDNSGVLRYVSVRFAGSNVDPENQLNGIAFQAVGDATEVDYVQVHNNLDDGIEFFGGTVNAKHVVLTGNADDSLDWTDGWTGRIQYLYIEQTDSADNAIEADNREGDEGALPRSNPVIANMSVYGKSDERALRIRRGTGFALRNSFIDGSERCLRIDGGSRALLGTDLTFEGVSFACAQTHDRDEDGAVASYLDSAPNVSQNGEKVDPVPLSDVFFDNTDFIGAFGAENWAVGWTYSSSVSHVSQPDFGCPDGTSVSSRTINGTRVCQLSGTVTDDLLLTSNNLYELVGKVVVGGDNEDSADLTVQAGTTIFGGTDVDFLVVSRGSRIVANGTRTAPITLTSQSDLTGGADIETARGLWGGLVINGNAPINDCPEGAAGGTAACTKEGEANSGLFGGDDPDDSSGVLNYVVVKFAGSNVDPENQLNGIAFQGVGSGTEVDYVQVHNNLDDGVEFFGGTVSARHMVLTGNADDSLDWTDGWQGDIQYLIIDQASDSGDNAIEADNREGDETATPRSLPRIANMTINGKSDERAIRLRRGTGLELYNAVVAGSGSCLRVQGDSLNQLGSGIQFDGVSFDCDAVVEGDDAAAIRNLLDRSNVSTSGQAVAAADLAGDEFFAATSFIGAVENADQDWTLGWTVGMPEAVVDFGCPEGSTEMAMVGGKRACQLSGTYTGDLALTRTNHYVLDGKVVIGGDNRDSAVLDIESGTTIIGDDPEDFLVISRGSRIRARGTRNAPITLTALDDVNGTIGDPDNTQGLWGGLVINGNAPINDCPEGAAGGTADCVKEGEANSGLFGGADPNDSSGLLNYVVVKFAGSNVDPENQLNGIAFQGVGDGTVVDYIQVYNNLDDGVEFFGGTVNASHVVLVGNADDSLDWTDGWVGSIQYLHIVQSQSTGDNMIEADNREGDEQATPISEPWIANMTMQGKSDERAIRLRRGTGLHLFNSIVSGSDACLRVQGESLNLLGTRTEFAGVGLDCATVNEGDDEAAVQTFLDGSANLVEGEGRPRPVALPARFDGAGSSIVGSDVGNWGAGWTVGVN